MDFIEALRPERAVLLELLRGLDREQWASPTECPAWDVQGLALHILGDDLSLLSRQRDATPRQGLLIYAEDHPGLTFRELLDGFNEQWVHAARFFGPDVIVELLRLVGDSSAAFYAAVNRDLISGEAVGFFADAECSPYWKVIAREYVERFIHQSQIRRAVGAPALNGDLVWVAADVVATALAAWLPTDSDIDSDAAIAVDFEGVGSWTWRRVGGGWNVDHGEAVTRISVAADAVVPLLSRGLAAHDMDSVVTRSGDTALIERAVASIGPFVGRPSPS